MTLSALEKYALVSGAASGIGRATSLCLAERGAAGIAVVDIDENALDEVCEELRGLSIECLAITADLTDEQQLEAAFDKALSAFGSLHLVHNNVGIMTGFPPFPQAPIANIDRALNLNLRSTILATQLAFNAISASGGGSILNTSSGAALRPVASDPVYSATKAGVNALVMACADNFQRHQVRINAICPGIVDTPMLDQNVHPEFAPHTVEEQLAQTGLSMLTAEQIAIAAVDLLLDETRYGELLSVNNQ